MATRKYGFELIEQPKLKSGENSLTWCTGTPIPSSFILQEFFMTNFSSNSEKPIFNVWSFIFSNGLLPLLLLLFLFLF